MESKKVEFFNKLSFASLLFTIFITPFFFLPYIPITLEAGKGFLLSIGVTLSLFFWLVSRLGDGKFVIPKDKLILFAGLIPLVFLISSFFSSSIYNSLFGSGFETGTFGSMLILFIMLFLSSVHFQSEKRLWYFIKSLLAGGLVLFIFELLGLLIDTRSILPGFFKGVASGNLVGSWNNFGLLVGIIILISLLTLELIKTKTTLKIVQYFLIVAGILFLLILNISLVWILVALFSVIILVYSISVHHSQSKDNQNENSKKVFPFASLIIIFIAFISLIGNNLISGIVSDFVTINNPDVRPSIVTTSQIAFKSFKHNPFFGTGPNTFMMDWNLWQPKDIAQTVFWNVDFANGYSMLLTFAVTTGLVGLIILLLFLVVYVARSIQSIRIALRSGTLNYFIIATLMISLYSWISVVLYNPNIIMLMLAFSSSGVLIGVLVYKQAIPVKVFSFLSDPRSSFFSLLGLVVLLVSTATLSYIYIEKFTSIIYFSKGMVTDNTAESLTKSERMLQKALSLDKNDVYYRALSQLYLSQVGFLINDKTLSPEVLKSTVQQVINSAQEQAGLAVMRNPKLYTNYVNLGNIYGTLVPLAVSNSYESAIASYDKALTLAPNNPSIVLAKASLEISNKNKDKAKEYINQALTIKPNYTDAIFLLVQIETDDGNLSEALKYAEYGGEVAPNDPTVFFRIGLLRYNSNDYSGAVSALEKAVILDSNYLDARYLLGQSYKKVGRKNDALIQFNILNKILPQNEDVKKAIGQINETVPEGDQLKTPLQNKN
ncbi:MAG TPA: tetratricopeptide repeat protein [Candidatus Paceibacterota bacterium]|nr:tetratricopeptide repeat protein [Candidatus Paceibacterota bacterium]